MATLHWKQG